MKYAMQVKPGKTGNSVLSTSDERKLTIKDYYVVNDTSGNVISMRDDIAPLLYVFNYKEGGYAIIAGDKRIPAVMAYAYKNNGISSARKLPEGLTGWFKKISYDINQVRTGKVKLLSKTTPSQSTPTLKSGPMWSPTPWYDVIEQSVNPILSTTLGH